MNQPATGWSVDDLGKPSATLLSNALDSILKARTAGSGLMQVQTFASPEFARKQRQARRERLFEQIDSQVP